MTNRDPLARNLDHPRLRLLDGQTILYEGMKYVHLRDPLGLSGRTLLVPQPLIPLLPLMDGTRDLRGLQAVLAVRYGVRASIDDLNHLIQALDNALFLENNHYQQERTAILAEYRKTGCRPSSESGRSYPQDAAELHASIGGYLESAQPLTSPERFSGTLRGIISPHIDFERGGEVYASVWKHAANSLRQADLVIILGTDHFSEGIPFSLTRQDYCTPLGRVPVDQDAVMLLASSIGEEEAFQGELHHRSEHSIELTAVWLQHVLGDHPVKILPILCGSIDQLVEKSGKLMKDSPLEQLIGKIGQVMRVQRTFIVAAGDMAHIGPAFGGEPVTPGDLLSLHDDDHSLIESILCGDAEIFLRKIIRDSDRNNVCGTAPIYIALQLLGNCTGKKLAYAACPADIDHTSFVSICGIVLA